MVLRDASASKKNLKVELSRVLGIFHITSTDIQKKGGGGNAILARGGFL